MTQSTGSPIWHPFTQHGIEPGEIEIARAQGAWLETRDGMRIFDAISSWWVITHGHAHPKLIAAIQAQAATLDQVIFAGFTHAPAEAVAGELMALTPPHLRRVFFSDSGSTAVEVALKMALGYWHNLGVPRSRILALEHAYHGDTVATMSAGARGVLNAPYAPLLFDVVRIPFPGANTAQQSLDALDQACARGDAAAFICEPLLLGAGGMLMYDAPILAEMHRICSMHNVLFIADEVMTGFGRTGTLFACEQAGITPDIMCLAKGLTGGALPLAATLACEKIYEAHLSEDRARMFFHSSSFAANPIACAAAAANLQLWRNEPVLQRIGDLSSAQSACCRRIARHAKVRNMRQLGTITAFDIDGSMSGYLAATALRMRQACLQRGVLIRPLGATVYVMPPYCTTVSELEMVYDVIADALDEVTA